jgi:hypothetical protein
MKKAGLLLVLLSLFLSSCQDEKNARIEVWLTDDPGDFQEVNVDVQGVEIHSSENDHGQGWQALDVTPKIFNLLELANGNETFLGDLELPGGKISQIRLKLGNDNSVKVNDETFALNTPSAQQSGLKVQIHQVLAEGITYKIVLDFDAAKSIVQNGNGDFTLKPVIRALTEAQDGAIKGKVDPAGQVSISVMAGEDVVTTTSSNDSGEFLVRGLEPATYRLLFDAAAPAPDVEKADIEVTLGVVTDIGTVPVEQ